MYFKNGNMHVSGKATAFSENEWKSLIEKTISRVQRVLNKPVKEVQFSLDSKNFSDISICPHQEEHTSYFVKLS